MKRLVLLLLAVLALLGAICAISGCEKEEQVKKPPVSQYKSTGTYPDLGEDQLTWEGLNALPMKRAGMPTDEARQVCVDFWRYCKTALWMPDERYEIYLEEDGVQVLKRWMEPAGIYAGLPYVTTGAGNLYRLFDFMDEETGVVDISEAGSYGGVLLGNVCSTGCYWSWARVMNSAEYTWSQYSVYQKGCLPVGPYTYDLNTIRFMQQSDQGTDDICAANGEQVIYQSYAAMDIADGLVCHWEKNGHIMMCSVKPVVVYNPDGTINGQDSYMHIIEQGGSWDPGVSAGGIPYQYEYSLDKKFTFEKLLQQKYIPFTFGEFNGTDPIEETEVTFSYSGETITEKQLFSAKVTSNYHISDIYVYVYDAQGNEIYKHVVRARLTSMKELKVHKIVDQTYTWGDWENVSVGDTVKVEVQLGTGERPVVWEGKIAAG